MALIENTAELKQFLPISETFTFSYIKPSIARAERKWLKPFIGGELYALLETHKNSSGSGSGSGSGASASTLDTLLLLAQEAVSHIAYHLYIPFGASQKTDQGFFKVKDNNKVPLNHYEQQELMQEFLDTGLEVLDDLYLALIEANLESWEHPDVSWLIPNATEFTKHYNINSSGRTYLQLSTILKKEFKFKIAEALPGDLEKDLKAYVQNESSTESNEDLDALLEDLKPALCHFAIAKASKELTCKLDGEAFIVTEYAGPHMKLKSEASQQMILTKGAAALKDAEAFMDRFSATIKGDAYTNYQNTTEEILTSPIKDAGSIIGM